MLDALTLVMAYYDNAQMLHRHCREWAQYPKVLRDRLHIIIVDDASPQFPAAVVLEEHKADLPKLLQLYRVKPNIPWNQDGARNLAMMKCKTVWAFMTDMDHLLPADQVRKVFEFPAMMGQYYMPDQHLTNGQSLNRPHPNSYLMSRPDFWTMGGYDEDFAGYYGTDGNFRRCAKGAGLVELSIKDFHTVVYRQTDIWDANTKDWGRKLTEYHVSYNPVLRKKLRLAPYRAERPVRFEYSQVL